MRAKAERERVGRVHTETQVVERHAAVERGGSSRNTNTDDRPSSPLTVNARRRVFQVIAVKFFSASVRTESDFRHRMHLICTIKCSMLLGVLYHIRIKTTDKKQNNEILTWVLNLIKFFNSNFSRGGYEIIENVLQIGASVLLQVTNLVDCTNIGGKTSFFF